MQTIKWYEQEIQRLEDELLKVRARKEMLLLEKSSKIKQLVSPFTLQEWIKEETKVNNKILKNEKRNKDEI